MRIGRAHSFVFAVPLICVLSFTACAPFNKRQLNAVKVFAASADSFAASPSKVYAALAEARLSRGLFFTPTLSDPTMRVQELDRLSAAFKQDVQWSKKADLSFQTLSQYMRALQMISSENRLKDPPASLRSFGRKLDSLLVEYNQLGDVKPLPVGYSSAFTRIAAQGGEWFLAYYQSKQVKKMVCAGDTLVSALMDVMIESLTAENLKNQLDYERGALRQAYQSYLKIAPGTHSYASDEQYLTMVRRLDEINELRLQSARIARSVKTAHAKMSKALNAGTSLDEDMLWVSNAVQEMKELRSNWLKIKKLIDG